MLVLVYHGKTVLSPTSYHPAGNTSTNNNDIFSANSTDFIFPKKVIMIQTILNFNSSIAFVEYNHYS